MPALIARERRAARSLARERTGTRPRRWLALGLVAIAVSLAVVALLGPLVTELIDHRVTETLRNQTIGLDAISHFLVAPLSLLTASVRSPGP